MKIMLAIVLISALAATAVPAAAQGLGRIEVGKPFPEIMLPSLDGEPMSIANFRGKKVVLHVFASW